MDTPTIQYVTSEISFYVTSEEGIHPRYLRCQRPQRKKLANDITIIIIMAVNIISQINMLA